MPARTDGTPATIIQSAMAGKNFAPQRSGEEERIVARWKELTEKTLPALAREGRWPIRLDHCFKRVTLDYAFEDAWYVHLPKPAERHLAGEPLQRALRAAEMLLAEGRPQLEALNRASLAWRGKLH